jgi:hypothetical protein
MELEAWGRIMACQTDTQKTESHPLIGKGQALMAPGGLGNRTAHQLAGVPRGKQEMEEVDDAHEKRA